MEGRRRDNLVRSEEAISLEYIQTGWRDIILVPLEDEK